MAAGVTVRHFAQDRPAKDIPRRVLRRALARAHAGFARQYPEWAASLFDEHFLAQRAEPLLFARLKRRLPLEPAALAHEWARQIRWFDAKTRLEQCARLMPAASDFLGRLEAELEDWS